MIGQTLLHYRILEELGQGGMGTVYLAEDTKLGRRVALKVLPEENAGDRDWLERFDREARAVAALNHPNIVTLFATERDGESHFLTMERVEGETLRARIPAGGLELDEFFEVAIPLADALQAAHEAGVLHRDLKPGNVMIDSAGRPKVLDFGLARIDVPSEGTLPEDDTLTRALADTLTGPGKVVGTTPYMSPEQARGKIVDKRSDLFALGAVYYQMLTGKRAFEGESMVETLSSVLRDDPAPVHEIKEELPRHLGRIVRHCLEKDPAKRFQSAADVRNELETLREEVVSGQHSEAAEVVGDSVSGRRFGPILIAAVVLLMIGGLWFVGTRSSNEPASKSIATEGRRSLAVLYFDNLSGDPELDWLRSGLPDMLVTELSQAEGIDVLGTDRVFQVLSDLGKLDERITSFEVVREIADKAGVETVVLGSVAQVGEQIRISVKIQEAESGRVLESLKADGIGQQSLFDMADQLGDEVRDRLGVEIPPELGGDLDLAAVATESIEAFRLFARARQLRRQSREKDSIVLNQAAVQLDPAFALAWVDLSVAAANLGLYEVSGEAIHQAFAHRSRLPLVQRLRVEEVYYSRSLETAYEAIEASRQLLELDPSSPGAGNLAFLLGPLEMYREAEASLQILLDVDPVEELTLLRVSEVYLGLSQPERAESILRAHAARIPGGWMVLPALGKVLLATSRFEEAEAQFLRSEEQRPGENFVLWDWLRTLVASGNWSRLEAESRRLEMSDLMSERELGVWFRRASLEYQGRLQEIVERWQNQLLPSLSDQTSRDLMSLYLADTHLLLGEEEKALVHLERATVSSPALPFGALLGFRCNSYYLKARAEARRGDHGEAERTLEAFVRLGDGLPGNLGKRLALQLEGELALERGDAGRAVDLVEGAEELLPPGDATSWLLFQRFRLWEVKGRAHLAADQPDRAADYFERMVSAGWERHFDVALWVQAHYHLAGAYEQLGRDEDAREYYRRFYEMWKDTDIRRDWVEVARSKLDD